MTLQEAIEEIKKEWCGLDYTHENLKDHEWLDDHSVSTAIATILNEVVKGELTE